MIIWGSKNVEKVTGQGMFHCPGCGGQQGYKHKAVKRYFTLYFIPLFPMSTVAEFVSCDRCSGNYKLSVLDYNPKLLEDRMAQAFQECVRKVLVGVAHAGGDPRAAAGRIRDAWQAAFKEDLDFAQLERDLVPDSASWTAANCVGKTGPNLNDKGRELVLTTALRSLEGQPDPKQMEFLRAVGAAMQMSDAYVRGVLNPAQPG